MCSRQGNPAKAETSGAAGPHRAPDWAFLLQSTNSRRDMALCLDANRTVINQAVDVLHQESLQWLSKWWVCVCVSLTVSAVCCCSARERFWRYFAWIISYIFFSFIWFKSVRCSIPRNLVMWKWWFYTKPWKATKRRCWVQLSLAWALTAVQEIVCGNLLTFSLTEKLKGSSTCLGIKCERSLNQLAC